MPLWAYDNAKGALSPSEIAWMVARLGPSLGRKGGAGNGALAKIHDFGGDAARFWGGHGGEMPPASAAELIVEFLNGADLPWASGFDVEVLARIGSGWRLRLYG